MALEEGRISSGRRLGEGPIDLDSPDRFLNRELSWLAFNRRVLELVRSPEVPLLERVKFLAIFTTNLDEFFQVRVAGLRRQVETGQSSRTADGRTPANQLHEVRALVQELTAGAQGLFATELVPALADEGVCFPDLVELDRADHDHLADLFEREIFPVLTPLGVDPGHPFPYISSLSLSLAVQVRDPVEKDLRFARVKVPPLLPSLVALPDGKRFVWIEQVIAAHIGELFQGMEIVGVHPFRMTRDADLFFDEDEASDLLTAMEMELRRRRFGPPVRLEVPMSMPEEVRDVLLAELELDLEDVFAYEGPIALGGLSSLQNLDRPELKYSAFSPLTERELVPDEDVDVFERVRKRDILLHHPYASFRSSVQDFVGQAAIDPAVQAIKISLYRTSGDSPIVASLIRAAEAGKQVAVLIELKARFDEETNIEWAKRMEEAGVHVVYGLPGLKTHAKVLLIVRREGQRLRTYCHIGTGNYNSRTADIYEDVGLLTSNAEIGSDLVQLFNYLTGFGRPERYEHLLVAPRHLREQVIELIRNECSGGTAGGHITMKMNSLVDPEMIDELYLASQAGVTVDLVVRGVCCLRPGVPGLSDHIRVRSIVGRYLEHSRISVFANGAGPGEPLTLIGSADLMPRNLDRRVEAMVPILDPSLSRRLGDILAVNLSDNQLAWGLGADGAWTRVVDGSAQCDESIDAVDTHRILQRRAAERVRHT